MPKRYKLLYFIDNSGSVSYLFIACVQVLKVGRQCEMSQIVVFLDRGRSDVKAVTSLRALPDPASQCQHQRTKTVLTTSIK